MAIKSFLRFYKVEFPTKMKYFLSLGHYFNCKMGGIMRIIKVLCYLYHIHIMKRKSVIIINIYLLSRKHGTKTSTLTDFLFFC